MGAHSAGMPVRSQFEGDSAKLIRASDEVKNSVTEWLSFFVVHRSVVIRNDEIIQGILQSDLAAEHPDVRAALERWEGTHFVFDTPEGTEVTLVRPIAEPPRERWWLHLLLGILTLVTTTAAGAYFAGQAPFDMTFLPVGPIAIPLPIRFNIPGFLPGFAFSIPLLAVLFGHEMGHYLVARRHGMNVSPPYFIPSPHWINVIGTFGAFIRLRSAVVNRIVLLDVGAAGPIVSFMLSIPLVIAGLMLSRPTPLDAPARYAVFFGQQPIWLGNSLLFGFFDRLVGPDGGFLILHPFAFAGWLGLFVTALNLFPLAQLDGGHILYALVAERQRYFGVAFLALLVVLGYFWWGWWLWAVLILVLGRGSTRHPSVFDPEMPVTGLRRTIGWACVLIFLLTFVPLPLRA